jgi:uncharacterized protein (TIGR00297 family)
MPNLSPSILVPGVLFAALFIWYTRRKKALTLDGAIAAAGIGLWVLCFAGPAWLLPLFFFFSSSTLLGKLVKNHSSASDAKQGKPRDFRQVFCNGGLYAVLATIHPGPYQDLAQTLMALSMAVSTADTWSSELGQYFRQKTVDMLRWQPVSVGLSGGVSLAGTLAGLTGATAMAVLCNFLSGQAAYSCFIGFVALGGFAGMLLDSLLGAGLQVRYRHRETGELRDQGGAQFMQVGGLIWMSNDAVNFWSNLVITLAGLVFW